MRILGFEISRRPTLAQRMIAERSIDIRKPNVGTGIANVSAGRKSVETPGFTGFEVFGTISRRKGLASLGLDRKFDLADFARLDFDTLTDLLIDLSPEIAKALWDALLMANSGYETKALNIRENEEGDTINKRGQRIVDGILKQLSEYHGTTGVFFDRVFKTLMARGSYMMELVLDQNGRDFIDIATPDTKTLEFKRVDDPIRGQTWV